MAVCLLLLRAGLHIHGLFARLGNIIHDSLQEAVPPVVPVRTIQVASSAWRRNSIG
jgi:hypothetical protein